MLNVACVYWKGKFEGRVFRDSDVDLLKKSVDKHMPEPYNFYCLTNDMDADFSAKKIKLQNNWPGWWSKIELFRPDLPEGKTLYIDLDSHAVRDLSPFFEYDDDLVMCPPSPKNKKEYGEYGQFQSTGQIWKYRSGVMLFRPRIFSWIYFQVQEDFKKHTKKYRGDQDLIADWLPNQPTFPVPWMAKAKAAVNKNRLHKDTKIITGRWPDSRGDFRNLPDWLEKMARG